MQKATIQSVTKAIMLSFYFVAVDTKKGINFFHTHEHFVLNFKTWENALQYATELRGW